LRWRERYNLSGLAFFALIVVLALAFTWAKVARSGS